MNKKNAQSAIEFLLTVTISLVLIVPALVLFFHFTEDATYTALDERIQGIGQAMTETTESVYYYGNGAKEIVDLEFPQKITELSIQNQHELVFTMETSSGTTEQSFYSDIVLKTTYPTTPVTFDPFNPDDYTEGIKKFQFENINGEIWITELD